MLFLYQIKRFFLIFLEESFLFIKEKLIHRIFKTLKYPYKKNIFFQKKGNTDLKKELKIKLDKKYYDFYSIQPKIYKPFYINSPLFYLIKKNKVDIFNNLLDIFNYSYDFKLKIGIELEFYISDYNEKTILKDLKFLLPNVQNIEKEKGNRQFEIKTNPYVDIKLLVKDYLNIIKRLENFSKENKCEINFNPTPYENDCGSALQINISLIDNENNNLFARLKTQNGLVDNKIMLNSIAGLLKNINNNLLLYILDKNCLKRFDIERNKIIKSNNKYPAPTFVSWGVNNRTASIRIPNPPIINLENYMEDDKNNRRIEYRIPSSNADIYLVLIGIISSIIEGIEDNLLPHIEKTSFDVLEKNENFEKIDNDFYNINDNFKISKDLIFFSIINSFVIG